jgi:hypothetical protein
MSDQTIPQTPDLSKLVTWTFVPPHGVRFQNDVGSSISCIFERGREKEVAESLQFQISHMLMWSLGMLPGQVPVEIPQVADITGKPPLANIKGSKSVMPFDVDEQGNIIKKE